MNSHFCTRIYPKEDGNLYFPSEFSCYGKDVKGRWWFKHKDERAGILFGTHEVFEHNDGTITVSPSIVGFGIHGYLEHGEWRDC